MSRASIGIVVLAGIGLTVASQAEAASVPRPRPTLRAPASASAPTATPAPTPVPTPRALSINHEEMGCVIVGKFPEFTACFDPASDLKSADMYFKGEKNTSWYRVPFKPQGK